MGRFNFFFDSLAVLTVCNVWAILSEMNDKIAREQPTRRIIKAPVRFFSDKRDLLFGAFFCCTLLMLAKHFGGIRRNQWSQYCMNPLSWISSILEYRNLPLKNLFHKIVMFLNNEIDVINKIIKCRPIGLHYVSLRQIMQTFYPIAKMFLY